MANEKGVWRTIGGRRVFIKEGQDLASAMKESGKFKSAKKFSKREELKKDIAHQVTEAEKNGNTAHAEMGKRELERLNNEEKEQAVKDSKTEETKQRDLSTENIKKMSDGELKETYEKMKTDYYSSKDFYDFGTENKLEELQNEISSRETSSNKEKTFDVRKYEVEVQHDNGKAKINVTASDEETAKKMVMNAEHAPESAIVGVKDKGSILNKEDSKTSAKEKYDKLMSEDSNKKEKSSNDIMNNAIREKASRKATASTPKTSLSDREVRAVKSQKALKSLADEERATDITSWDDKKTKALRQKHGGLEKVKVTSGLYGMNGALLRSRETGEYFVITSRNSNLFYWV